MSIKDHVERLYSKYWWYGLYDTHVYHVFSVPQLYTNYITLKISMVYRRHSGVQWKLKAIPHQSNVKARQVYIVFIFRKFVFQVLKKAFQGNLHTSQWNVLFLNMTVFCKSVALDQRYRRHGNKLHIKYDVQLLRVHFNCLFSLRITRFVEFKKSYKKKTYKK